MKPVELRTAIFLTNVKADEFNLPCHCRRNGKFDGQVIDCCGVIE